LFVGALLLFLLWLGMTFGVRMPARLLATPRTMVAAYPLAVMRARPEIKPRSNQRRSMVASRQFAARDVLYASTARPDAVTFDDAVAGEAPAAALGSRSRSLDLAPPFGSTAALTIARPDFSRKARPASLFPMYGTFAALQAADVVTTVRALRKPGLREANPFVKPFAQNVPSIVLFKAGSTAVTVLAVEKLWRKNPLAAVATMITINVAYGVLVSQNAARIR
jgi:hypothetical protein